MTNAMNSYMALSGNELVNAARLKVYTDNGLVPRGFEIFARGCDGLDAILPCIDSDPPIGGYSLPELDPAPWYDVAAPESANFAGLLVTSVEVSAPYSRSTTANITQGQTLGRLKLQGRTIVVHGWLIGKTCCSVQYGLRWLTTALGETPCGTGDCGGGELDLLDCCPSIGTAEGDCITTDAGVFVRPAADSEYQRAEDFFRRMNGVGVVDGPNVISVRGNGCGCGCAALTEVEFTLATSSPYFNSFGTDVIVDQMAPACVDGPCQITWIKDCDYDPACPPTNACLDDPLCPPPPLPPTPSLAGSPCGCIPTDFVRSCSPALAGKEWDSATLNIEVKAGSSPLRNLAIRVWQNPIGQECGDPDFFPDCAACSTLLISYIPADSTLIFSGETRTVEITCGASSRDASSNITTVDGQPFSWPDFSCTNICVCATYDCNHTSPDASLSIVRIDRDL